MSEAISNKRARIAALEMRALGAIPVVTSAAVLAPIAFLLMAALSNGPFAGFDTQFTIAKVIEAYSDPAMLLALWNSVSLGVTVAALATGLTVPMAWLLVRTDMPGKWLYRRVMTIAFYISPMFLAIAWGAIAAPRSGFLSQAIRTVAPGSYGFGNVFNFWGIVFVSVLHFMPISYLLISGAMATVAGSLEEAAHMSRAGHLKTFLKVTLPLIRPTMMASLLQVSVFAAEQFALPYFLGLRTGYHTLPTQIFTDLSLPNPDYNRAAAGGTMLLWFTVLGIFLFRQFARRGNMYATLAGKASGARLVMLRGWRWPASAFVASYSILAVLLPLAALAWGSFNRFPSPTLTLNNLSLFHWKVMLDKPTMGVAIRNSLLVSFVGSVGTVAFCLLLSFLITRTKVFGRTFLDYVSSIPLAFPSLVLSLGFLPFYLWSSKAPGLLGHILFGTLFGLIFAFAVRYMGYAVRALNAGLQQIHTELTEAAYMSRASNLTVVSRIQFPLLRPTMANTWVVLFVSYVQEINLTVLLATQATVTVPIVIFQTLNTALLNGVYPIILTLLAVTFAVVEGVRAIPGYGSEIDHATRRARRRGKKAALMAAAMPDAELVP